MLSRLGLGTVQFGLKYGVSNRAGRPDEREVAAILARSVGAGVGYIDTAPAYGDAEILVGRYLPPDHSVRIITKTPALLDDTIEACHAQRVLDTLAASLERLKVDAVYGLLVHQSGDLGKPGWQHLVDAIAEAQARGWTRHIGASVYNSDQLAVVETRFRPELVQLSLNVLDRRPIISGTLARLKKSGVEVHARSVFLQGLLLMEPDELPEFFLPLREKIVAMHRQWKERNLSPLAGCLAFALQQSEVDAIIVGANTFSEVDEIIATACGTRAVDFELPPLVETLYLDPSRWPASVH